MESPVHEETKPDDSPVTMIDRDVNAWFIDQVRDRFPGDGVLGEEESLDGEGDRTWVIDPVDGTRQLLHAIPTFMVSIALVVDGRPVVAAAANPSTGQCYWAEEGSGTFRDGVRLQVSRRDGTGGPAIVGGAGGQPTPGTIEADGLLLVSADGGVGVSRYPWPTVFSGCKVAEGAWDADLYRHDGAHDVAAVCLLVREAGGTVTDRHGNDQRYDHPVDGCIASNGLLHPELVRRWAADPLTDVSVSL